MCKDERSEPSTLSECHRNSSVLPRSMKRGLHHSEQAPPILEKPFRVRLSLVPRPVLPQARCFLPLNNYRKEVWSSQDWAEEAWQGTPLFSYLTLEVERGLRMA
jgi:hypothetical protein